MPSQTNSQNVPPSCPNCGAFGTVKLETTVKGANTSLLWRCTRCDHRWPAKGAVAA
jgi:transposase-like protein